MDTKARIEQTLTDTLSPTWLEVVNESGQHNVPAGSTTHFKVVAVTQRFENMGLLARHRMIYDALGEELRSGVHALALHTYSPAEWQAVSQAAPQSPACRGGGEKNR